jgi:hypothetical protein
VTDVIHGLRIGPMGTTDRHLNMRVSVATVSVVLQLVTLSGSPDNFWQLVASAPHGGVMLNPASPTSASCPARKTSAFPRRNATTSTLKRVRFRLASRPRRACRAEQTPQCLLMRGSSSREWPSPIFRESSLAQGIWGCRQSETALSTTPTPAAATLNSHALLAFRGTEPDNDNDKDGPRGDRSDSRSGCSGSSRLQAISWLGLGRGYAICRGISRQSPQPEHQQHGAQPLRSRFSLRPSPVMTGVCSFRLQHAGLFQRTSR